MLDLLGKEKTRKVYIKPLPRVNPDDFTFKDVKLNKVSIHDFVKQYPNEYGLWNFDKEGLYNLSTNKDGTANKDVIRAIDHILGRSKDTPPQNKDYKELNIRFFDWFKPMDLSLNDFKQHPNFKILQGLIDYYGDDYKQSVIDLIKETKKEKLAPWVEEAVGDKVPLESNVVDKAKAYLRRLFSKRDNN